MEVVLTKLATLIPVPKRNAFQIINMVMFQKDLAVSSFLIHVYQNASLCAWKLVDSRCMIWLRIIPKGYRMLDLRNFNVNNIENCHSVEWYRRRPGRLDPTLNFAEKYKAFCSVVSHDGTFWRCSKLKPSPFLYHGHLHRIWNPLIFLYYSIWNNDGKLNKNFPGCVAQDV